MKRILIALALLPSTYVQAEAIMPKSPVDFCMSGVCLLDDSSKYPSLHKANAKSLKELNDKSFCKESYYGLQDPIVKNGNSVHVNVAPYVKGNGTVGLRITEIKYFLPSGQSKSHLTKLTKEYTEKYKGLTYDGEYMYSRKRYFWKDSTQEVTIEPSTRMAYVLSVEWQPNKDLKEKVLDEVKATKPACDATAKL